MDTSVGFGLAKVSHSHSLLDVDEHIPALSRRYFSIGEVARLTGLRTMTIRYWQTRYPGLGFNLRQIGDRRRYRPSEFVLIIALNELISVLGMTSDGASAILKRVDFATFVLSKERSNEDFVTRNEIRSLLCHAFVESLSHGNHACEDNREESRQFALVT